MTTAELPASIARSLNEAQRADTRHKQERADWLDGLPPGTRIGAWQAIRVPGESLNFWERTFRGKVQTIGSRQAAIEMGVALDRAREVVEV